MQWSPQQDKALLQVQEWLKSSSQVFRLFGYAGTGKTTLAKEIATLVDGPVLFGAFTGKAAYVLQQKGCNGASTIHSLIYLPRAKSALQLATMQQEYGELENHDKLTDFQITRKKELEVLLKKEKENLKRPAFSLNVLSVVKDVKLVIIDECSMVDEQMGLDLLSFGTKVLVLGDPAQLPPVGSGGYFTEQKPDVMLTEIHRQARDNPIIRMATLVREGNNLPLGNYGSSVVKPRGETSAEEALSVDQIICGKNATRFDLNKRMRKLLSKQELCEVGDKLVCLRNNQEIGILNGSIWNVQKFTLCDTDSCLITIADEEKIIEDVYSHTHYFTGRELDYWEKRDREEFDFGYALTCHKSQGSQWNKVMVFDEASAFRSDAARWLYTAITRAGEEVIVLR